MVANTPASAARGGGFSVTAGKRSTRTGRSMCDAVALRLAIEEMLDVREILVRQAFDVAPR